MAQIKGNSNEGRGLKGKKNKRMGFAQLEEEREWSCPIRGRRRKETGWAKTAQPKEESRSSGRERRELDEWGEERPL